MKSTRSVPSPAARQKVRTLMKALVLGLAVWDRNARAQYVLAPTPQAPDQTPPAVQQVNAMDVFANPEVQAEAEPFKWKDLTLRPHAFYQFLYADGLRYGTNQTQVANTLIQTISPGALLELGTHWTLDYSPEWTVYSQTNFSNTFNQAAKLTGGFAYEDWIFSLVQGYTDASAPSVETAAQTRQQNYSTAVEGLYTINTKVSLDLGLNQSFVSADQFSSYREWSTMDWLNYQFRPRLNVALGLGAGYDNEDTGPDMTFQRVQGRVNWRATDKLSFQVHGGVEVREFMSGGAGNLVNPLFDATIQYRPFDQTKISLTGQRTVSTSYLFLQDQVTEITSVSVDLNQRLLGTFFLDLNGGYQLAKYVSSAAASSSNRRDDYYFLNAQLKHVIFKRGSIAVLYQINKDNSSVSGYGFTSHQVGFQIGYSY